MLKAALFDMDGLLFDTEAMYARLANEAARPLGFAFTEQMILDTLGVNETDCNAYYGSRIPGPTAPRPSGRAYHAAADRYVAEHGAPQKPYLLETLQRLHAAGVRMAVVSASPRADVLRNLRSAGAETYFDAIVSGDMGLPGQAQARYVSARGGAGGRAHRPVRRAGGFAPRPARGVRRGRVYHHDSRSAPVYR